MTNYRQQIKTELKNVATKQRAEASQRYFKTGPGEYAEGDMFIGATMQQQREIAKRHKDMSLSSIQELLDSSVHEERMIGLVILTLQYPKASEDKKEEIYNFYLRNSHRINNWDLVDVTAPRIIGAYLVDKDKKVLIKLAQSKLLWDRRIAILSTMAFIDKHECEWTFKIAKMLLKDQEDLIHKAVGWMLREVGKNCGEVVLMEFLDQYACKMPRTMLRYAIEKFDPVVRQKYLIA